MDEKEELARRFEEHRADLRAVAYRMLGSTGEADDAVQEAWLRLARSDAAAVENLRAWLTTAVARVCLDLLRARKARREEPLDAYVPDPVVFPVPGPGRVGKATGAPDPAEAALTADSVGLALLVVLETLSPAERLAFVLHDLFAVPFEDIAPVVGRSPEAARQLASRARRRVQGAGAAAAGPDADLGRQREVVDAFLAASRRGDFEALLAVLDPDVVLRADRGAAAETAAPGATALVRGARAVAGQSLAYNRRPAPPDRVVRPAVVNGAAGVVVFDGGRPAAVLGFTVARGRVVEIAILSNPDRLRKIDWSAFGG